MSMHELNCFSDRFQLILDRTCKADVRFDDRNYAKDDTVILYEGYPDVKYEDNFAYTGRVLVARITNVDKYAVQDGFAVLSLEIEEDC